MRRWKFLRDRYVRELKKLDLSSGSGASHQQLWHLFETLDFLRVHVVPKKTRGNFPTQGGLPHQTMSAVPNDEVAVEIPPTSPTNSELSLCDTPSLMYFPSMIPFIPSPLSTSNSVTFTPSSAKTHKRKNALEDISAELISTASSFRALL